MDINLTHPIRLTQLAISHFLERKKSGTVVHVSSIAGQTPFFPTPLYVASKHAMNGFVRSLGNLERPPAHIPKIRVNCVAPARILTPLWTDHPEKMKMVGKSGNWTTPEAVAQVMLDLVEKEEYVGGSIVEVGKNVRVVSTFNDAGPQGHGNALTSVEGYDRDTWESMEKQMGGMNGNGTNNGNGSSNGNGTNGSNGNGV
jgi:3-hydroxybutyrate dehydrogenase